jgi:hypothetical protein
MNIVRAFSFNESTEGETTVSKDLSDAKVSVA